MTANDKQTTKLDALDNSFEEANWVQCFNHTTQLSVNTLLAPFNTTISGAASEEDHYDELLPEVKQDNEGDNNSDDNSDSNEDDEDDGVNEPQELSQDEYVQIMESMADVCATVTKVWISKQKMLTF